MSSFLPDANVLSENWKISQISEIEDIEIPIIEENPDVVLRQYVLTDQKNGSSIMIVTINIYEFSSKTVSENVHEKYVSDLSKENIDSLDIEDNTDSKCVGFIKDRGLDSEGSTISCLKDNFIVISTSEQDGPVFEDDKQVSSSQISAVFAGFVINKIVDSKQNEIPQWIKNNARWWSEGTISDNDFVQGIQYLIQQDIMKIPPTQAGSDSTQDIPAWIKNNAGWWANGQISDSDFLQGIQWLIENGIMKV